MRRNRFQQRIVTGRFTLPVAIVLSTLIWIAVFTTKPGIVSSDTYFFRQMLFNLLPANFVGELINYLLYGITGYMLIELNNAYSVIRMRTSFQCTVYVFLVGACSFLFPLQQGSISNLCLIISVYFLFRTYQKQQPVGHFFHSFLFIGLGSILFPQLLFYVPLLLIGAYNFKSLTARTFFAGIFGLSLPYWFLLGHAFFYDRMELFYAPFVELSTFLPIGYSGLQLCQLLSGAFVTVLFIISSIHSLVTSYQDKIKTRSYLNFFILITMGTILFCFLQPQFTNTLFPILLTGSSLLIGHLFVLTATKSSDILFIVTLIFLITLAAFNLWTLL